MKREIKQRIELINNGEVPVGYKKTKAGIMPLEWLQNGEIKAKDIFTSVSFKNNYSNLEVLSVTQDKGVIPRNLVNIDIKYDEENTSGYKRVDKSDFVISLRSFQGGIEYSNYDGIVSPAYTVLKPIADICDGYYKSYFKSTAFIARLNQGTYGIRDGKQIGFKDFGNMLLHYPSITEQEKIAEILATQDRIIELKQKQFEEKEKQKKYSEQLFFDEKKKEWKWVKANELFGNVSKKNNSTSANVLSATQDYGVIPRREIGIEIKFNEENIIGYKVVDAGDFIISLRSFQGGIEYSNYQGVVSPAYTVIRNKTEICKDFYKHYFKTRDYIEHLKIATYGIRDGKQISYSDFSSIKIPYPPIKEQKKIANVLNYQKKEIDLLKQDLEQEKQKKKALMQLLLTGIVRVK